MSELAEFAGTLHESLCTESGRVLEPVKYPSTGERLYEVRAVICDVYGTLIDYWRDEFDDPQRKVAALHRSFKAVAEKFGMTDALLSASADDPPEKTLCDFYHGLITLKHEQASRKGIAYPEIIIEQIWELIIRILERHGYFGGDQAQIREAARRIAWFYNGHSLGRALYPEVTDTIAALKKDGVVFGLLSNAQFYTPVDLTLLIREQSGGRFDDFFELFEVDLTFFSYEYQVAKPDRLLFRKLYDALYEYQILPSQTVFVGNDLAIDIAPAQQAGMKTALFTGDRRSTFLHDLGGAVVPDITFSGWAELTDKLSFHSEG
ncbi:MAG: HAD family hydrolase [Chitinispirillaceae bacterium]|nr:HAD family hydrolase [Chitinispirillaceae bacterium]